MTSAGQDPQPAAARAAILAQERKRGLDRVISFSDAVVSIAATLLVLPLVDTATAIGRHSVDKLLSGDRDEFLVFVLSFVVICRFWFVHHHLFQHLVDYTTTLVWVNCLWLLSIVFLPFPTQLIATADHKGPLTFGLYVGTMLVTTAAGTLMLLIIIRSPTMQSAIAPATNSLVPSVITTLAMTLALIVAVTIPAIGLWALLLLVPAGFIGNSVVRKQATGNDTTA
jgi:TMEM175 potassium channel family protein